MAVRVQEADDAFVLDPRIHVHLIGQVLDRLVVTVPQHLLHRHLVDLDGCSIAATCTKKKPYIEGKVRC